MRKCGVRQGSEREAGQAKPNLRRLAGRIRGGQRKRNTCTNCGTTYTLSRPEIWKNSYGQEFLPMRRLKARETWAKPWWDEVSVSIEWSEMKYAKNQGYIMRRIPKGIDYNNGQEFSQTLCEDSRYILRRHHCDGTTASTLPRIFR